MLISAIVAMSKNRVIGKNNQLPWHLPADLRHFKKITMGKPILMGRKTFESIGKALPGRCNVVITHDLHFQAPGCVVATSIDTALAAVGYSPEVFIIGGAQLYTQLLPKIQRLYITQVECTLEGDAHFPPINEAQWCEIEHIEHAADTENNFAYRFIILSRVA